MNLWAHLEKQFDEQIAGTPAPDPIPQPPKSKDAEPFRVWHDHEGAEL